MTECAEVVIGYNDTPDTTNIMAKVNAISKRTLWYAHMWHSDADPLNLTTELNSLFTLMDKPVSALKLGIVYNKYHIAKKLYIHYPRTALVARTIYAIIMISLMIYAMVQFTNSQLHIAVKMLTYILFVIDAVIRIATIYKGISTNCLLMTLFIIPATLGTSLWLTTDYIGLILYCMSFMYVVTVFTYTRYVCMCRWLLE